MTTKGRLRHRREAAKGRNGWGLQREEETERTEGGNSTTLEDEGSSERHLETGRGIRHGGTSAATDEGAGDDCEGIGLWGKEL